MPKAAVFDAKKSFFNDQIVQCSEARACVAAALLGPCSLPAERVRPAMGLLVVAAHIGLL